MSDRKKYELADFNDKTSEYEEVSCECGSFLFKTFLPIYDERGITEESFFCDCGIIYHWAYGNVVEKVDDGINWLLKRAEDARSAEQNLSAVKRELRKSKDENKRYREALEQLDELFEFGFEANSITIDGDDLDVEFYNEAIFRARQALKREG